MSEDKAEVGGVRQLRFTAPPTATEILLVRHGESMPANPEVPFPLLDGHGDPELAPEGRHQAERIAARLVGERIDAIYVTTLRRTHETAAPLAAATGLVPIVEAGLREVRLGEWEGGLYRSKVLSGDPVVLQMFEQERWEVVPGAESNDQLAGRVRAGINRIAAAHPGGRVVAFAHGAAIGMVLALTTGSRPFAFVSADNGNISVIVVAGERWHIRGFNDVSHLRD